MWRLAWLLIPAALTGCHGHALHVVGDGTVTGTLRTYMPADHTASPIESRTLTGAECCCCGRIALIDIDGLLVNRNMTGAGSMGENPVALLQEKLAAIRCDSSIRAVLLRINSPGGSVTACDVIRRELEVFKFQTGIPVVAALLDVGAGGAYYIATVADSIIAHPTTITGGIGVVLNLYNLQDSMAQFNILGLPIKSGEHIDLGSPIKGPTPEARHMLQSIADGFHTRFRKTVVDARRLVDPPDELFDGRIFAASDALARQLIDQIGYLDDAVQAARQAGGLSPDAQLVVYRRQNDRALSPYDITPNIPLQHSIMPGSVPGFDRSQLPTFLYLWQPEPLLEKTGGN